MPNPSDKSNPKSNPKAKPVPSPKGTRDLYPDDLLRQRYITEAWRRVSIRHGFEEIAGPTFEMRELYTRKSGEGIVSELFSFRREGGDDDYALRPEFTPTLARMYAAKAASLPSPTKWFTAGPYFRAERPQRGRLREFLQWNCDVMGGDPSSGDTEVASCLLSLCSDLGLDYLDVGIALNDRAVAGAIVDEACGDPSCVEDAITLLDKRGKIPDDRFEQLASEALFATDIFDRLAKKLGTVFNIDRDHGPRLGPHEMYGHPINVDQLQVETSGHRSYIGAALQADNLRSTCSTLSRSGYAEFCGVDFSVVRGLAYYTGTVFELIADGERAVAGGGRYDNLIELFGGPPTPAVGFGMGDVVLGLLLEDKNLMPEGAELREALSQPPASLRPEAFVIADEAQSEFVEPLLADLRRGIEAEGHDAGKPWSRDRYDIRPLHARRSYKPKRKKQVQDASNQAALFTVTIDEPDKVSLKSMDTRQDLTPVDVPGLPDDIADFSVDPASPVYVGRAISSLLGG